jgi:hypothetical protein
MHKSMIVLTGIVMMSAASAKLPPLSDEAKAKAAEEKSKVAWTDKVAAYKLCMAQDRVAAYYMKTKNAKAAPPPPSANAGATASPVTAASAPATAPSAVAVAPSAAPAAASGPAASASVMPAASSNAATPPVASAAPVVIPPCQDPGPYAAAQAGTKVGVADSLPVPAAGKSPSAGEAKK